MSRQHKFKVGDIIKILDGKGIKDYAGGWYPDDMSHLIGKTYKIFEIYESVCGEPRYRIRDEEGWTWCIDERGAEKVEINKPILITEYISKKGRRVIEANQDGVVGSAVCHPEDEFIYGVNLALIRLKWAQKRKARKEAEIEALMENNYMTKGFVI